jgi:hypothetical protein
LGAEFSFDPLPERHAPDRGHEYCPVSSKARPSGNAGRFGVFAYEKNETMKNFIGIIFTLTLLLVSTTFAQQRGIGVRHFSERRVALVIGNSAYEVAPLKNPVNDARDMAHALGELGFELIYRENLNQNDMKRSIREFGAKIRDGGVGLFYYAGHGVAVKGINYLVPVDAKVEREEQVEYECVDAGFVLSQMDNAGNRLNIVILDACRNNPFARTFRSVSRGLAQMDAPSGTLIAYATAPGSVASDGNARNGLYTQELLKFIRTPNMGIEEVFKRVRISIRNLTQNKQTPWESSSLTGDFYFSQKVVNNDDLNPRPDSEISKEPLEQVAVYEVYVIRKGLRHKARLSVSSGGVKLESYSAPHDPNYNFSVPCEKLKRVNAFSDSTFTVEIPNKSFRMDESRQEDNIVKAIVTTCYKQ